LNCALRTTFIAGSNSLTGLEFKIRNSTFNLLRTELHERSQIQRELEIFIDETELQQAFDEAYKAVRPRLELPGFRKGKAPMSFVRKMHGDAIEGDALEKLAEEKFREVIDDQKIEPIGNPVITDIHRHTGEGAHFKVAYEIQPQFELQDFTDLEVEHTLLPITDEDVDERIERLRFGNSEREDAQNIQDENTIATISMTELDTPIGREPGKSEGVEVYLADPEILPEIKNALLGKNKGRTVELELPKRQRSKADDSESEERGRVLVTIEDVKKVKLPALDEEFAQKVSEGKYTNVDELRTGMKKELEEASAKRSSEELEERIVEKLLEKHDFEVPRTLIHAILDQMMEERRQQNTRRAFPPNYGIEEDEFRHRMGHIAESRGKWMLLREKLIEAEGLEATDEDLEKLADAESEKYGLSKDNLLKYYRKYDSVKNQIVSDKLGTRLREKVKVIEKPVERAVRT
jgi:trigger factor